MTLSVGAVSTIVGTMAAMGLARLRRTVAAGAMTALAVPVMVPPLMLGITFLSYYTNWLDMRLGLHRSFSAISFSPSRS